MKIIPAFLASLLAVLPLSACADQPNILWIDIDDQSPWYGVYGDETVSTPNLDELAGHGVVFTRAYTPVPVCAPARSAMVTGVYPIRAGTHDMRSGRVREYQIILADEITTMPELLRKAGYQTYNAHKDDYNFSYDRRDLYSIGNPPNPYSPGHPKEGSTDANKYKGMRGSGSWRDVEEGPFFGQMSIPGGKSVGNIDEELRALGIVPVDPAAIRVPAQYPDIPLVRKHVANHYNSIQRTDHRIGELVQQFKDEGLWGNTVFILYSDHGSDLPRSKSYVYEEGLHIPFIIAAPGIDLAVPGKRDDLVSLMDIAATTLGLAGVETPEYMDARDIFAEDFRREYVFSSADRMSNVIDRTRSVMGKRFHYIRNFMLDRPLFNWGAYEMIASMQDPEGKTTSLMAMRRMAEAGELEGAQAAPYGKRVAEELYDLQNDPDEVNNLAADPAYKEPLSRMRNALSQWIAETDDKGQYPRSAAAMSEVINRYPPDWLHGPEFQKESPK